MVSAAHSRSFDLNGSESIVFNRLPATVDLSSLKTSKAPLVRLCAHISVPERLRHLFWQLDNRKFVSDVANEELNAAVWLVSTYVIKPEQSLQVADIPLLLLPAKAERDPVILLLFNPFRALFPLQAVTVMLLAYAASIIITWRLFRVIWQATKQSSSRQTASFNMLFTKIKAACWPALIPSVRPLWAKAIENKPKQNSQNNLYLDTLKRQNGCSGIVQSRKANMN